MSLFGRTARTSRQVYRLERGVRNPARYARNRAVAKGLGALGFWRLFGRLWR